MSRRKEKKKIQNGNLVDKTNESRDEDLTNEYYSGNNQGEDSIAEQISKAIGEVLGDVINNIIDECTPYIKRWWNDKKKEKGNSK